MRFLHHLGRFMAPCGGINHARPGAISTLPCLDFASPLVASGIVVERFRGFTRVGGNLESWKERKGQDVSFAYKRTGARQLRRLKGCVSDSYQHPERERILIKLLEAEGNTVSPAVDSRWLGLTELLAESPCLDNLQGGSLLATGIESLESTLAEALPVPLHS